MKKPSKKYFYYSLILSILFSTAMFLSSCNLPQKPAVGKEDEIFVIADSAEYFELEPTLLGVFGKLIRTPQEESLFTLTRKDYIDLESLQNRKNLIIIAPLNSDTKVSKYISAILDSTVKEMVESGEEFVFNKYDLWAQDQLVMVLTGRNLEELNKNILEDNKDLVYFFQTLSNKRLSKNLYSKYYEKREIQGKILKEHGWVMYVQADFHMALNKPDDNFVWLRRAPGSDMERWVFVHWIDNASPTLLNKDSVIAIRERMTKKFYKTADDSAYVKLSQFDEEPYDDYNPVFSEVNFLGRYAIMLQGFWRFTDKSGGGPVINYTFYDEASKRIYMLDGSIYAPKYYKKKLIQQVDVLLQSFMTEAELSEDRREELLSAIE